MELSVFVCPSYECQTESQERAELHKNSEQSRRWKTTCFLFHASFFYASELQRKIDITTQIRQKMEEQEVEQLDAPMILVVKGHFKERRNKVAYELAKHLKYPLIDQDEITPSLQNSQCSDRISFDIALTIASIQVKELKLGVIISTSLSQRPHLDSLKKKAKCAGAVLVIIQCLSEDESDDFNIEGVPRLIVEEKTFVAEEFVSDQLDKVRKRFYRHLHPLIFHNKPIVESEVKCSRCQKSISSLYYQCFLQCGEYIFDKACAELPGDLEHVRKNCPPYLSVSEPEYLFPKDQRYKCKICEYKGKDFSDSCHDCLFQTNMIGKFLPIIVNHESHAHPLNLVMIPLSYNYEFRCSGCGDFGNSISYRCYDCNFNLHVSCILLPRTISYDYDKHPLRLTYDSLEQSYLEKSYCEACKKERNPEHWFYYCPACESTTHLECLTNQSTRS